MAIGWPKCSGDVGVVVGCSGVGTTAVSRGEADSDGDRPAVALGSGGNDGEGEGPVRGWLEKNEDRCAHEDDEQDGKDGR